MLLEAPVSHAPFAWQSQGHQRLCDPGNYAEIESGLTWLGVAGLQDPPRGEVRGAIQQCAQAGVRVRTWASHPSSTSK